MSDIIGKADLYDGVNVSFTNDRFGRSGSAISLLNGYYKVPSGVYFSGTEFTIMVWLKVRNFNPWARIIDFGNGPHSNNVQFSMTDSTGGYPFYTINSNTETLSIRTTLKIELNKWVHLASVFSQPNGFIYIDGVSYTTTLFQYTAGPANILRTSNFVGRSNWWSPGADADANADFDELKIFNRALSQQEIKDEMNNNIFL